MSPPIAIIGAGCVFPDAPDPSSLARRLREGHDARRLPPAAPVEALAHVLDRTVSVPAKRSAGLVADEDPDPLAWLVRSSRASLEAVGGASPKTAACFGLGGLPSPALVSAAEDFWLRGETPASCRDLAPGPWLRDQLDLLEEPTLLEGADASSELALARACRELTAGRAEVCLAGAAQGTDRTFLLAGPAALGLLADGADGLAPGEGCGVVALELLDRARAQGHEVLGVLRGRGFAHPGSRVPAGRTDPEARDLARRRALADAALPPDALSHVEGPGSTRASLGHTLQASGMAGLLKILGSFRDAPRTAEPRRVGLAGGGWNGVASFLVIEEPSNLDRPAAAPPLLGEGALAIAGLGLQVGACSDAGAAARALAEGLEPRRLLPATGELEGRIEAIALPLARVRYPPRDLERARAPLLLLWKVALEAMAGLDDLEPERTGLYLAAGPDTALARVVLRGRLPEATEAARDRLAPRLDRAAALAGLPWMLEAHLRRRFDIRGPGWLLQGSAEAGARALEDATRALLSGEVDAALVGAVDLACEPLRAALSPLDTAPADAAVALVLRRAADAPGSPIFPSSPISRAATFGDAGAAAPLLDAVLPAGTTTPAASGPTRRYPAHLPAAPRHGPTREGILETTRAFWHRQLDFTDWPGEYAYMGLLETYLGRVSVEDPEGLAALKGKPALFLANHQIGAESLLMQLVASGLTGNLVKVIAKLEHGDSPWGRVIQHFLRDPVVTDPDPMILVDRADKASVIATIVGLRESMVREGYSLAVHVEGTRSLACGQPVRIFSSIFVDLARALRLPIVPVRLSGALPREELPRRIEFPLGFALQDLSFGRVLPPDELAGLPMPEAKALVLQRLNETGPDLASEDANPGRPPLAERVRAWQALTGGEVVSAAIAEILSRHLVEEPRLAEQIELLQQGILSGEDSRG